MCTRSAGYNEAGVMSRLTRPLADTDLSIFKVTTVTNDYSLMRVDDIERAVTAVRGAFPKVQVVEEEI